MPASASDRFFLCTNQKLIGMFGANSPRPMPVIGFYGGDGTPQWIPAGFDMRLGRRPPHCHGVSVDPERFDALSVQVAAKIVGASKEGIDDLAERLRVGGEPVRLLANSIIADLVKLATTMSDGAR